MTSYQKMTLEKALARAEKARAEGADLRIIAIGKVLATSQPVYFVPSQSVPGMWHAVIQVDKSLKCDCYAAQRGTVCVHRATVYSFLKARAEAAKKQPAPQPQPAKPAPKGTPAQERPRHETALLATDDQPFSLFKTERRYQTAEDAYAARDGSAPSDHYQHAYR